MIAETADCFPFFFVTARTMLSRCLDPTWTPHGQPLAGSCVKSNAA